MSDAPARAPDRGAVDQMEALTRRYRAALLRYFTRRGIAPGDVDDLTQRVFLKLCQRGSLDAVDNLAGYLFATAAHVAVEHFRYRGVRRARPDQEYSEALHRDAEIDPERQVGGRQELACILAALSEMPERMRQIFILARLENLPRAEIAMRMGVSKRLVEHHITLATACLADRRRRST